MKLKKNVTVVLLVIVASLANAAYIDLDFDSDVTGSTPTGVFKVMDMAGNGAINVVDSVSTPADPFGGTGNKSLYVLDASTTKGAYVAIQGNLPADGISWGTLSFDFYVPTVSTTDAYLYLGYSANRNDFLLGTQCAVTLKWCNGTNKMAAFTSGGVLYLDNPVPSATVSQFTIDFVINGDGTGSWSGTLNGSALTKGSSTVFSTRYALPAGKSINQFDMCAGTVAAADDAFFVDNILLVPEPATMVLLGLGMCLLRKRN